MKNIRVKRDDGAYAGFRYPDDIERIVEVFAGEGYHCTYDQAQELWEKRSEMMCASWLILPDDDADLLQDLHGLYEEE